MQATLHQWLCDREGWDYHVGSTIAIGSASSAGTAVYYDEKCSAKMAVVYMYTTSGSVQVVGWGDLCRSVGVHLCRSVGVHLCKGVEIHLCRGVGSIYIRVWGSIFCRGLCRSFIHLCVGVSIDAG